MRGLVMTPGALKVWRSRVGYTQTQLAEELGVNQSTIVRYEKAPNEDGALPIPPRVIRHLVTLSKTWKVDPPKTRGKLRGGKKTVKL